MKEKSKLAAMTAIFIGLSAFCWGTVIWSGGTDFVAAGLSPETQPVTPEKEYSIVSSAESNVSMVPETIEQAGSSSDTEQSVLSEEIVYCPLTEEEACLLAGCFASAGTPFFDEVSELSVPQLETAAIWWGMELGEMPAYDGENVVLPAEEMMQWIWKLFGRKETVPMDCELAVYNAEKDAFILSAAAIFPVHYPVISDVRKDGSETRIRISLLSADGWEGDVMGNIYLPETVFEGVMVLQDGLLTAWQEG